MNIISLNDFLRKFDQELEVLHQSVREIVSLETLSDLTIGWARRDDRIYEPGDQADTMFYVLRGAVRLYNGPVKKKKQTKSIKSVVLEGCLIGDLQLQAGKRRYQTAIVESDQSYMLIIGPKHTGSVRLPKKQHSHVFSQLSSQFSYQVIPKMFKHFKLVKNQRLLHQDYPIAIINYGEFQVKKNICLNKEDVQERIYQFNKTFSILSFGAKETVLWDCTCKSASAEVTVITRADFCQITEFDGNLLKNVVTLQDSYNILLKERVNQIQRAFGYKDVEESLGLDVKFKTEGNSVEQKTPQKKTERARMIRLREEIIERSRKPRYPEAMKDVLFKMPFKKSHFSAVRNKIQELQSRVDRPQYTVLNTEVNRLFSHSPSKFQRKMLEGRTTSMGKSGGFAFFKERQTSCRKRRSLILLPN